MDLSTHDAVTVQPGPLKARRKTRWTLTLYWLDSPPVKVEQDNYTAAQAKWWRTVCLQTCGRNHLGTMSHRSFLRAQ